MAIVHGHGHSDSHNRSEKCISYIPGVVSIIALLIQEKPKFRDHCSGQLPLGLKGYSDAVGRGTYSYSYSYSHSHSHKYSQACCIPGAVGVIVTHILIIAV